MRSKSDHGGLGTSPFPLRSVQKYFGTAVNISNKWSGHRVQTGDVYNFTSVLPMIMVDSDGEGACENGGYVLHLPVACEDVSGMEFRIWLYHYNCMFVVTTEQLSFLYVVDFPRKDSWFCIYVVSHIFPSRRKLNLE